MTLHDLYHVDVNSFAFRIRMLIVIIGKHFLVAGCVFFFFSSWKHFFLSSQRVSAMNYGEKEHKK